MAAPSQVIVVVAAKRSGTYTRWAAAVWDPGTSVRRTPSPAGVDSSDIGVPPIRITRMRETHETTSGRSIHGRWFEEHQLARRHRADGARGALVKRIELGGPGVRLVEQLEPDHAG